MEEQMKKTLVVATAVLFGTSALALAAENKGGASKLSPGHEMQNSGASKGASEFSPGDRMRDKGTVGQSRGSTKGASEFSPGDRMNDKRGK
jgi:hypothetical protein